MSTQITNAHVEQYKANVQILVQQKGSRLRGTVNMMDVIGKNAFVEQLGSTDAQLRTTRHGDSPQVDTPHARRRLSIAPYEWGDLIDDPDKVRTLVDFTSPYSVNASWAMGRAMDDVIIAAASGTAFTGVAGGTSTTFDTTNQRIAVDFVESGADTNSGLTVGKLREIRRIFGENDLDDDETLHIIVAQQQLTDLLRDDEVTNADYNTVRTLVNGEINTYMGFQFHRTQRLTINTSTDVRTVLAYPASGLMLGIGQDIKARITERSDKSFSTYVYYSMDLGAVRLEEKKVVEVLCDESP